MNKHLCADSVSRIAKKRPEHKSIGGFEIFLQVDFKILNFKRFPNFFAQNGRPKIITLNKKQKERVVGDCKNLTQIKTTQTSMAK